MVLLNSNAMFKLSIQIVDALALNDAMCSVRMGSMCAVRGGLRHNTSMLRHVAVRHTYRPGSVGSRGLVTLGGGGVCGAAVSVPRLVTGVLT